MVVTRLRGMHILVVEDHGDTRSVLRRLLEHCGYDVAAAENVHDALSLLENLRFDVLLSDIGLPDGDGLQLVKEAKKRHSFKKAVALTAWDRDEDRERGLRAGFDDYLTKPLDFMKLRSVLAQAA